MNYLIYIASKDTLKQFLVFSQVTGAQLHRYA